jgi:MFS family permease
MPAPDSLPPAAPVAQSAPAAVSTAPRRRLWRAGTLVYTTPGLVALFAWLLWGDFAWNMKERAIVPLGQLMLREFGASDLVVGLLVGSVPAAIGLVLGPIISVRSDRHRGRLGRRIPFLLLPTPFIVASMFGLAAVAPLADGLHALLGASSPGLEVCRLAVFAFFWTGFEIFQTIAQSVLGGLINDVVPAELIGRFFGLFRAVSLIAAIVFNFWLIGHAEAHATAIFLGLGTLFGLGFTLMCLRVKEGEYPPPPPPGPRLSLARRLVDPVRAYLAECFAQPYYLWVFLALMLGNLAGGPVNSFSVFYAKSLGLDMTYYGRLLVVTYSCSLALSFFIGWLADKFHPLRLGIASLAAYAALMLWGAWAATDPRWFAIAFVAHGVLTGIFFTGTASLGQRLFPRAKFAQFASAAGILGALGYLVLPAALGAYLDATGRAYRHTFALSGLLALLGLSAFLVVWRRFRALGGPRDYVAP